jgi:dipeptidyl aminopeptidase/acylaminoacyl peptidase
MSRATVLAALFVPVFAFGATPQTPLTAAMLTQETQFYADEAIVPSPDGRWIAFQTSNPANHVQMAAAYHRFTKTGYPLLASAEAATTWVTEVANARSIRMPSGQGSSWGASWSHDSRYLAYFSDQSGEAALWIWDRQTGSNRQLSHAPVHPNWWRQRPQWSADGRTIITQVVPAGMTRADLDKLGPHSEEERGRNISPQSAEAVANTVSVHMYTNHVSGSGAGADAGHAPPTDAGTEENSGAQAIVDSIYLSDVVRIDVATGEATLLVSRITPISLSVSPDESRLAIMTSAVGGANTQDSSYGIWIYDFASGQSRQIATGLKDANNLTTRLSWSPDSRLLAYSDTGKSAKAACYVIDLGTGNKVEVSARIASVPGTALDLSWGPPIWDSHGRKLYLLDHTADRLWEVGVDGSQAAEVVKFPGKSIRDFAVAEAAAVVWSNNSGKTLYVRTHDAATKQDGIYAVDPVAHSGRPLIEGDFALSVSTMGTLTGVGGGRGGALIYSMESASQATDIWKLDLRSGKSARLTSLNPQYDAVQFGNIRIIDWRSLRGESLQGALLLPAGYTPLKRYPLIVWVYGGDRGSERANHFGFDWGPAFNPQMWASRGYAVLYPDVPPHPGTPVDDLVSAVIPGVNKAVEMGIADPQRLGLSGQSFGGYNTIALLTRTPMFKAAVATSAAAADLFEGYSRFVGGLAPDQGYYEEGQGGMRGTPWEFRERYLENSPYFSLDRVTTPLLIARGLQDHISSANGSVYAALKRLHKEVEFLEYDNEGHVLQQPANVADFWQRRIDWMQRFLVEKR